MNVIVIVIGSRLLVSVFFLVVFAYLLLLVSKSRKMREIEKKNEAMIGEKYKMSGVGRTDDEFQQRAQCANHNDVNRKISFCVLYVVPSYGVLYGVPYVQYEC